jgi:uncharacterized membrane protein
MDPETLVVDYLDQLRAAASGIPEERRDELVAEVREHIDYALAEAGAEDETTVRNVLERLGSPIEIVAAEAWTELATPIVCAPATAPTPPPALHAARAPLSVEARALLLLTIGAVVLPFFGPLLGLWFVSASTRWSLAQKRTAALIVLVLLALPAALLIPAIVAGEITWVFTSGGFLLPFVPWAGIAAAAYLVVSTSLVLTISRRS